MKENKRPEHLYFDKNPLLLNLSVNLGLYSQQLTQFDWS